MAACGAKTEEAAAGCPALPDDLAKTLKGLCELKWGAAKEFQNKAKTVSGKISKADMKPFTGTWVKSDKVFTECDAATWTNYNKYLAETLVTDKTIKAAENTDKNADGTVCGLWLEMKMGTMISNRDVHFEIKKYKMPADLQVDDMKVEEVTVWRNKKDGKEAKKKPVRMQVLSFCLNLSLGDKGFRTIDFDNYDFGGSLPTKIVNKLVGNPDDYNVMAGYLANIKKNNGVFKA